MAVTTKAVTQASCGSVEAWPDAFYSSAVAYKLFAGGSTLTLGVFPERGPNHSPTTYSSTLAVAATSMEAGDGLRIVHNVRGGGYGGETFGASTTNHAALGWTGLTAATWTFSRTHADVYPQVKSYLATVSGIAYTEAASGIKHRVIGSGIVNARSIVRGAA